MTVAVVEHPKISDGHRPPLHFSFRFEKKQSPGRSHAGGEVRRAAVLGDEQPVTGKSQDVDRPSQRMENPFGRDRLLAEIGMKLDEVETDVLFDLEKIAEADGEEASAERSGPVFVQPDETGGR